MKTIAKVMEAMLSKPATPTWDTQVQVPKPALGPTQAWIWGP